MAEMDHVNVDGVHKRRQVRQAPSFLLFAVGKSELGLCDRELAAWKRAWKTKALLSLSLPFTEL